MSDGYTYVAWTSDKLKELRKAYKQAKDADVESFVFEGHELLMGYAKYLIEYLEMEFG